MGEFNVFKFWHCEISKGQNRDSQFLLIFFLVYSMIWRECVLVGPSQVKILGPPFFSPIFHSFPNTRILNFVSTFLSLRFHTLSFHPNKWSILSKIYSFPKIYLVLGEGLSLAKNLITKSSYPHFKRPHPS